MKINKVILKYIIFCKVGFREDNISKKNKI